MDLADAVAEWVEHGFVVLPGYLPADDVAAARPALHTLFPTADEFHDDVDPARNACFRDDEYGGIVPFPFPGAGGADLALLALHPKVVALAEAILETDDIRLYSCEAWAKYTGAAEYDQAHHRDFSGHTPMVPSRDPRFREVEIFVYLSDVPESCAPTRYVSRTVTQDLPFRARPNWYGPDERPALYEAEVSAAGPAGTVVAYSVETVHRPVALTEPRGARFTLMPNFRAAANDWMNRYAWAVRAHSDEWYAFVERASLRQLLLLGFPPPGHPYWTADTIAGTALRYPGLDLSPWRAETT